MNIKKELFKNQDKKYKDFTSNLIPNVNPKTIIGVRIPILRQLAKKIFKEDDYHKFINTLPHKYFEENCLHGFIIEKIKDYDECIKYLNEFLSYIDNWMVSDTLSPKVFIKHKEELLKEIKKWLKSKDTYTIRFAVSMLMSFYLDEDFKVEHLDLVCKIKSNEYYVNMMRAWYFATALAKQRNATMALIKSKKLDVWTHNKTIQKAIESYRISEKDKNYLRKLKIKK